MRASLTAVGFTLALLGGLFALGAAFEPKTTSPNGALTIESEPAGAQVFLDGKILGKAPLSETPPSGAHKLAFRLEGYAPAEVPLDWQNQHSQHVHQRLQPLTASLTIREVGKAKLQLGPGIPQTLEGKGPWKLAPGRYELTAVRDKIPAKPKRFEVKAGQSLELALDWPALPTIPMPVARPTLPRSQAPAYVVGGPPLPPQPRPRYNYYQPPAPRPVYRAPVEPLFTPIPATHYEPPPAPAPSYPAGPEPVFTPLP